MAFFTQLGYTFNEQFTDDKAACMVIEENIFAMLITEGYFKTFTNKPVANAHNGTEVIIALSSDSRQDVDELVEMAVKAGGSSDMPVQDHGWMYGRGFVDLDGHMWETIWMDPKGPGEA